METVNDLYKRSLALYDEISKTGEINASKTADYFAKTPFLADLLQKELWDTADYTRIFEFGYTESNKWIKTILPTDFQEIKKVVLNRNSEYDNILVYSDYTIEKDGNDTYLYICTHYPCTVKVQYKPFPTTILTIDDNIQLDTITSTGLAYGLCRYFAMSEQNDFVEAICNAKFNEIKNKKVKVPAYESTIIDVYGFGGING